MTEDDELQADKVIKEPPMKGVGTTIMNGIEKRGKSKVAAVMIPASPEVAVSPSLMLRHESTS